MTGPKYNLGGLLTGILSISLASTAKKHNKVTPSYLGLALRAVGFVHVANLARHHVTHTSHINQDQIYVE